MSVPINYCAIQVPDEPYYTQVPVHFFSMWDKTDPTGGVRACLMRHILRMASFSTGAITSVFSLKLKVLFKIEKKNT